MILTFLIHFAVMFGGIVAAIITAIVLFIGVRRLAERFLPGWSDEIAAITLAVAVLSSVLALAWTVGNEHVRPTPTAERGR